MPTKKKLLFLANVTCTDDSNHHECNLDPDLDGRHDDRDPNTSEDGGGRDVEAEEDEEEGDAEAEIAEMEEGWEPPRDPPIGADEGATEDTEDTEVQDNGLQARQAITPLTRSQDPIITQFPNGRAGRPLTKTTLAYSDYQTALGPSAEENVYAPFRSCMDYEVACWAQLRGPGATAFTELLHIQGVSRCISFHKTF